MKMKIRKRVGIMAVASLMCLGMGPTVAASNGMKHSAADFNKDGMVTESELVTFVRMHFMTMDKNNDHMVDSNEWAEDWFLDQ